MMMARIIIISIMLLSFVGCKTTYKANSKSELARLCLNEFPLDRVPIETKTDTVTIRVKEFIEVDCDTIGKKQVEHECEVKTVTKTKVVQDSRQTYLIQNLEGRLELATEHEAYLIDKHKDELTDKDSRHEAEVTDLKLKRVNDLIEMRKGRNKWRLIAIIGGVAFVVLKRFRII